MTTAASSRKLGLAPTAFLFPVPRQSNEPNRLTTSTRTLAVYMKNLSKKPLDTIDRDELSFINHPTSLGKSTSSRASCAERGVQISNVHYLGSYNWTTSTSSKTIIVPGCPPIWRNAPLPYTLPTDRKLLGKRKAVYVDHNRHMLPDAPLLPVFMATDVVSAQMGTPPYDWSKVDIICDRTSLRRLLKFVGSISKKASFRIDLERVGRKTMLMTRWENKYAVAAQRGSYGHSFEQHATTAAPGCEDAETYHRVIGYDLSGINMVVRFEVDACLTQDADFSTDPMMRCGLTNSFAHGGSVSSLGTYNLGSGHNHISVRQGGTFIPQSHLVELKTRRKRHRCRSLIPSTLLPQLLLSQTRGHYIALYESDGLVDQILTLDDATLAERMATLQPALARLRIILAEIQARLMQLPRKAKLSLVAHGGVLALYRRHSCSDGLPSEILPRFRS